MHTNNKALKICCALKQTLLCGPATQNLTPHYWSSISGVYSEDFCAIKAQIRLDFFAKYILT